MSDPSKVLLFGSFTEDETRSWIGTKKEKPREPSSKVVQPQATNGSVDGHTVSVQKSEPRTNLATSPISNAEENGHASNSKSHVDKNVIVGGEDLSRRPSGENFVSKIKQNGSTGVPSGQMPHNAKTMTSCHGRNVIPCGLINSGNLCFLNATLQALMSCTPFVQLLNDLRIRNFTKDGYPTIAAFFDFINEIGFVGGIDVVDKDGTVLETRRPFTPIMFESVLRKFSPDISSNFLGRSRQEDAQEFLSFIMDQMHDELLKLDGLTLSKSTVVSTTDDDGWETVGPKNKSAVTRTQSLVPSELSSIFGGQLRSTVKAKAGNKASATVQPFLLLHLDISHEHIRTIEDALHFFSAPETLNEYRTSTAQRAAVISARKSVSIESLPKILILHLKRFGYGTHGSTKLDKAVRFPFQLVLNRDLLVSTTMEGRKFELVATITHHGNVASKGHYTADALRADGWWLRFNDESVEAIQRGQVLHGHAYLLFYRQV